MAIWSSLKSQTVSSISISQALASAHTLSLDRFDAQLLLLHALGKPDSERAWLLAHDDDLLPAFAADEFCIDCSRRAAGEPLAYIVGYKDFFGLRFLVDSRVLVPRPDTETLTQWALDILKNVHQPDVLDLGTGSGAVAIAIAAAIAHQLENPVTASDFSRPALMVALENARRLGVDVRFVQSDWFKSITGNFHLIACNPPYIANDDAHLADLTHEPVSALTAGPEGLSDIRRIVQQAPDHLQAGGWLLLEHGYDQAAAVRDLLIQRGFKHVQSRMDLAEIERCSGGQWIC